MVRILIVCGTRLYREGLAQILAEDDRTHLVQAVEKAGDLVGDLGEPPPDVVLLDFATTEADTEVQVVRERFPETKVVALGVVETQEEIMLCAKARVAGYVVRDASLDDLLDAVAAAARGELRCSPRIAAALFQCVATLTDGGAESAAPQLTRREREIAGLLDQGLTNKEIAAQLFIEVSTVKVHVHNILEKLEVRTRGQAVSKLRQHSAHGRTRPIPAR